MQIFNISIYLPFIVSFTIGLYTCLVYYASLKKIEKNTDAEGEWSEWNEVIRQQKRLLGTGGKKEKIFVNLMICKVKWTMHVLNTIETVKFELPKYLFSLPSNQERISYHPFEEKYYAYYMNSINIKWFTINTHETSPH